VVGRLAAGTPLSREELDFIGAYAHAARSAAGVNPQLAAL
jgi:hypothetical protein